MPHLRTALLSLLLAGVAAAQVTGSLTGAVARADGRALSGARVSLTPAGSELILASTTTSRAGVFLFSSLQPGSYDVMIDARLTLRNVRIGPGRDVTLAPVRLAEAAADVPAPEQSLQTDEIDFAVTVDAAQMSGLPLPARDPMYAVGLLPGIQNNGRAPLAVYGESIALGNITYDGVNVRSGPSLAKLASSTTLSPRAGQVREASVITGAIHDSGGAQIVLSPPSGGSELHGSAYWLAAPGTAAQSWTDAVRDTPATASLHQLGAAIGGALRTDRLFYFLNYEAVRDRSTITRTSPAPATALHSSDPLLAPVLDLIPASASGTYRGLQNRGGATHLGLARLDYRSGRHAASLTFAGRRSTLDDPTDSSAFGRKPVTTVEVSDPFLSASWRLSITSRLTNEARAGANLTQIDFRNALRSWFPFVVILEDPNVAASQPMLGMDPRGAGDHVRSYQDNLSWLGGKHTLQAGVWLQQYRLRSYGFDNGPLDSLSVPRYVVSDIAQGTVTRASQRFNILSPASGYSRGSTARSDLTAHLVSGYFHEHWKLARSFSISLGIRYDYLSPADERTGASLVPKVSGLSADAVYSNLRFSFIRPGEAFYHYDVDNWSPYMGLAWKPLDRLPLVFRGGFNIIYTSSQTLPNATVFALRNPFQSFDVSTALAGGVALSAVPPAPVPELPADLTLVSLQSFANSYHSQPGAVFAADNNLRTPNVKYWNAGIETRLRGVLVDIRYLGNRMEEGPRSVDRNQVMLSPAFLAAFGQVQADLQAGRPTSGFPGLLGGGLCANFSLTDCRPDVYARALILSGQAGELGRWYEGQGYNPGGAYNFLGTTQAPNGIFLLSHLGAARFDALQLTVSHRGAGGLALISSYVLSKVVSSLNDYRPGAIDPFLDLNSPSLEWAPAPFNLTHALKAGAAYDLRFLKRGLLSGWSISGTAIAQSGAPFSLLSGLGTRGAVANSGENTVVSSLTGKEIRQYLGIRTGPGGAVSYVHAPPGAFAQPGPGAVGNLQRRMFSGPGAFNLNLGVRKAFAFTERARAEFRAEAINLSNHVDWLVGDQTYVGNGEFDNNIRQWNQPRTVQFSVRVLF